MQSSTAVATMYTLEYLASRIVSTYFLTWSITMNDFNALLDFIDACHLQGLSHILSAVWHSVPDMLTLRALKEVELHDNALIAAMMMGLDGDSAYDSDSNSDRDGNNDSDSDSNNDSDSKFRLPKVSNGYNGTICCIAVNVQTYDQSRYC